MNSNKPAASQDLNNTEKNSARNYSNNPWGLVVLISILAGVLILGVINLNQGHGWGDDFAAYMMQAQALVEGRVDEFVISNTFTIEHSIPGLGPVIYPWGYPLVLAPVYAALGHNLMTYKLMNLVFYITFLAMVYLLFRRRLGQPLSLLLAAFFALHPAMRGSFNEIGADLLFLFLVYLGIFLIDNWIVTAPLQLPAMRGILLGAALFAATITRTSGFILLPTLLVSQGVEFYLQRKTIIRWKAAFLQAAIPYFTLGILWVFYSLLLPTESEAYLNQINLAGILKVIYRNLLFYTGELLPGFWAPAFGTSADAVSFIILIMSWLLLGVSLVGAIVNLRRDLAIISFCVMTILMYLAWPYTQGMRFIYPLLPFLVYFCLQGLRWVLDRVLKDRSWVNTLPILFLSISVGVFLISAVRGTASQIGTERMVSGPYDPRYAPLFTYVKNNTPEGSVVAFFKPRALRLLSDRVSFTLVSCEQVLLADFFAAHHFKKMITNGQIDPASLDDCASQEGVQSKLVYGNEYFSLYQITWTP